MAQAQWCTHADVVTLMPELANSAGIEQVGNAAMVQIIESGTMNVKQFLQGRYLLDQYPLAPVGVPYFFAQLTATWSAIIAIRRFDRGRKNTDLLNSLTLQLTEYQFQVLNGSVLDDSAISVPVSGGVARDRDPVPPTLENVYQNDPEFDRLETPEFPDRPVDTRAA